jgi:leucyl aminopeptidase
MNRFENLILPDNEQDAVSIHIIDKAGFDIWLSGQGETVRASVKAQKFVGAVATLAIVPPSNGGEFAVVAGVSDASCLSIWSLAKAADVLPAGCYRATGADIGDAMIGWMLGQYRYLRYREDKDATGPRILLTTAPARISDTQMQAEATALVRDLVNCPAADLGPEELANMAEAIAKRHKAKLEITLGDRLEHGYPMIHAVGKAAPRERAPRLIEMTWGDERHPRIALIGKGITFDSGGLDMKGADNMRLMKKDMGGAAHALALAQLVMKANLPVRLHLLIAAAENSVGGAAFRPGDVLNSRAGISVEIDNTDAEGRLVLADALTRAGEENPELIIDFATLTGAARTALGPDLPALFANDDDLAASLIQAGKECGDPVWQLPLWEPYEDMLTSDIAETSNSGGAFAGAITAALFLRKFVPKDARWVHFDTYSWRPAAKPGRPKGGEALGLRAVFRYLAANYPAR